MTRALCLLALLAWAGIQGVQANVILSGLLGEKALISVNGGPPKVLAVGEAHKGVKLLAVRGQQVEIEEAGQRRMLGMGFSGGGSGGAGGGKTVLIADGRGQFFVNGDINGSPVRFVVDTGATLVSLPRSVADRAGVRLDEASVVGVNTANGRARAYKVMLNSVQVGEVRANMVEALVMEDRQLHVGLLGMSFLNRFNMSREGDQLALSRRY